MLNGCAVQRAEVAHNAQVQMVGLIAALVEASEVKPNKRGSYKKQIAA